MTDSIEGVAFDLQPGGEVDHIAWTIAGSDDAWLVLDRNHDGIITDGAELFGNFTEQPEPQLGMLPNGYSALSVFDVNHDDVIGTADPVFSVLRLWRDINHNGISDPGELSTLTDHGIIGLGTDYTAHRRVDDHGNLFRFSARVYAEPRSRVGRRSFDVFLVSENLERQARDQGLGSRAGQLLALVVPNDECSSQNVCTLFDGTCWVPAILVPGDLRCDGKDFVLGRAGWIGGTIPFTPKKCSYGGGPDLICGVGGVICCPDNGCQVASSPE